MKRIALSLLCALCSCIMSAQTKSGDKPCNEDCKKEQAGEGNCCGHCCGEALAPDFTLTDINGKELSLSSLRGKYVVLDFWGSWCGWCIKGMPAMKEAYGKYKKKMEILGIDCNDSDEAWKAAVKKHELPWKHVYCPRGSKVPSMYAIQGFPTKIVVDPKGKVVKVVVGEDPKFYDYLDELFGK